MTAATTTRRTPHTPWSSHSQTRTHQRSSTTPLGVPTRTPGSVGQPLAPHLSTGVRSPKQHRDPGTPSPGYFGLVVDPSNTATDTNAGGHVNTNWSPPSSVVHSTAVQSPKVVSVDPNPEFEAFRRQSESHTFSLSHGSLSQFSLGYGAGQLPTLGNLAKREGALDINSPKSRPLESKPSESIVRRQDDMDVDIQRSPQPSQDLKTANEPSFFDIPRQESPINASLQRTQISYVDDRHPRLSLPQNKVDPPTPPAPAQHIRADTLPVSLKSESPIMITAQNLTDLLQRTSQQSVLLLDLRVAQQFTQSRIKGAINLCIPTTLLRRPAYNVHKLADTFKREEEREKFAHWKDMSHIVLYDASSAQLKDATSSVNTLKKFTQEGWQGTRYVVRGGFSEFSRKFPDMIDDSPRIDASDSNTNKLSIDSKMVAMPVAGGCAMPSAEAAANPFFGNIRQNMDLIGGVGQMPITRPSALTENIMDDLPAWIQDAANAADKGKTVAGRFLQIETAEQARMQKALSGHVHYGSPTVATPQSVQIAGIEKGTKNRYKDMLPYDHSRVRLQNVPSGGCDYINASHVKAAWSNRHYIATQAPVPATFEDFWRLVWEQDARVVVMLTAETEGGQRKCHPYWLPETYGPLKLKLLAERRVALESTPKPCIQNKSLTVEPLERPGLGRRRATNPHGAAEQGAASSPTVDVPHVIIRKLTLSHTAHPFQPLREITQLQYSNWPDFGAPAHPTQVLSLIEHCGAVTRGHAGHAGKNANLPEKEGERPIVVHCSAGCGRTGTFCTVDSVVDMLKRQRVVAARECSGGEEMEVDGEEWVRRQDVDLVAKTVEELRAQRLSMVQTLRQFVLCYETVLEWLVKEAEGRKKEVRRSFHG